jgi:hypothetical protein
MIALIKDSKVVGFLAEDLQKDAYDPTEYSFIEFEWEYTKDNPPMLSEATLVDGGVMWQINT